MIQVSASLAGRPVNFVVLSPPVAVLRQRGIDLLPAVMCVALAAEVAAIILARRAIPAENG